jgi:hypothetical protein
MELFYRRHFPEDWSDDKILRNVTSILNDPESQRMKITSKKGGALRKTPKYFVDGIREGKKIRVVVEPDDRGILTAYPID